MNTYPEIKELNSNLYNLLSNLELGMLLNEGSTILGEHYV
jgi:hypothetical protein